MESTEIYLYTSLIMDKSNYKANSGCKFKIPFLFIQFSQAKKLPKKLYLGFFIDLSLKKNRPFLLKRIRVIIEIRNLMNGREISICLLKKLRD